MKLMRKIGLLSLLLFGGLFIENATAAFALPDSSYAQAENNWQGSRIYEEAGFNVWIDFVVYDTEYLLLADELELAERLDTPGRYIYAYQIFNHFGDYEQIGYFEIFGIGEPPLDVYVDSIDAVSDSDDPSKEGVKPSGKSFRQSHSRGVWVFSEDDGDGPILAGEHSWFLVFSSDCAPVVGDYEIKGLSDFPVSPEIPEPTMMTLLVAGAGLMLVRRRRAV